VTRPGEIRYPVYIPSKNRADIATTPRRLDLMGVPYRLVVEEGQYAAYAANYPESKLLVLPESYIDDYPALDGKPYREGRGGAGPARNFIWDHAAAEGHPWHWMMDDNINAFGRLNANQRTRAGSGWVFAAMEDFCGRYTNVGLAGPEYAMFLPSREKRSAPFTLNTRVFSCMLIRNDMELRWRGRYNEDVTLNIDVMKAGWCVVKFTAFYQEKKGTQRMEGGMTEEVYARDGTLTKSQFLARIHPDIVSVTKRFNRWHHVVDFSPFRDMHLMRDPAWTPPAANPYQVTRVPDAAYRQPLNTHPARPPEVGQRLPAPLRPRRTP
jgi:TET-Associated Glycosyltransferase